MSARITGFLAVVLLQFLILGSVAGYKGYTVATGETILLKVVPVDPRSLFRGDYVNLSFDISRLDRARFAGDGAFYDGRTAYAELSRGDDGYWHAVRLHDRLVSIPDDHVMIKGKVLSDPPFRPAGPEPSPRPPLPDLRLEYGIEQVFVPEGSGRAVETSQADLGLEVKVDRFGNAVARRIFVDGEPYTLERK